MISTSLEGEAAIVTGGGGIGCGLGAATALAREGVAVMITGRTESKLQRSKAKIETAAPNARIFYCVADNTDHDAAQRIVDETVKAFGRLDILVNNAQIILPATAVLDTTWDDMMRAYDSGVFAYWRLMNAAHPYLKEHQGTIINFGSGADSMNVPEYAAYGSNKAAVRSLSRIAAKEWGPDGITVNVIEPYVYTEQDALINQSDPELNQQMLDATPLRRRADGTQHVGSLCVYLSSPEGKMLTGGTFDVDGGASIRA